MDIFERTALLAGKGAVEKLKNSRIAVFGIGGVGGYVVEALVRSGVGALDLIDADTVSESNLNRQIIAVQNTVGMRKVDAVDTVTAKAEIIKRAKSAGVPVISSMGTGNKFRPDLLEVDDIYRTSVCPLARVMRSVLRKAGVDSLKVVYSKEKPVRIDPDRIRGELPPGKHTVPGSTAFVPAAAGLIIAAEVFSDLTGIKGTV